MLATSTARTRQIARYLPFNLYPADRGEPSAVRVLNKTGFSTGVRADTAIIEVDDDPGFVIAVLSERSRHLGFYPEHPANIANGLVARIVFEHWYAGRLQELARTNSPLPDFPFPWEAKR